MRFSLPPAGAAREMNVKEQRVAKAAERVALGPSETNLHSTQRRGW
jgi:hypothetical protein